jgi:uncharacterized protein YndB with AHSA1/START domain
MVGRLTSVERVLNAAPETVFATLVDLAGLPRWNDAIVALVEAPDALSPGSEWVVEMAALGQHWHSRSTVLELDPATGVFAYRSRTDDGNPSFADWRWVVRPRGEASHVTVTWDLHPMTFWRRRLLVHVRNSQLARTEVPRSLDALAGAAAASA